MESKKLLLAVSFSLYSFLSYADPTTVFVPCLPGSFYIEGTALYLQPSITGSDLDFASLGAAITPGYNASNLINVEFNRNWNWQVEAGTVFPDTANDLFVTYQNITNSNSEFANATGGTTLTNLIFPIDVSGIGSAVENSLTARAKISVDKVDIAAGQQINIGQRVILHPYGGGQIINTKRYLDNTSFGAYTADPQLITELTTFPFTNSFFQKSSFTGGGPLVGTDVAFQLFSNINLAAHLEGALIAGNNDSSINGLFSLPGGPITGSGVIFSPLISSYSLTAHQFQVTGDADAKLGLNYIYQFSNEFSITLEAGYDVSDFFNMISKLNASGAIVTPVDVAFSSAAFSATLLNRKTENLLVDGPYVSLTVHI